MYVYNFDFPKCYLFFKLFSTTKHFFVAKHGGNLLFALSHNGNYWHAWPLMNRKSESVIKVVSDKGKICSEQQHVSTKARWRSLKEVDLWNSSGEDLRTFTKLVQTNVLKQDGYKVSATELNSSLFSTRLEKQSLAQQHRKQQERQRQQYKSQHVKKWHT